MVKNWEIDTYERGTCYHRNPRRDNCLLKENKQGKAVVLVKMPRNKKSGARRKVYFAGCALENRKSAGRGKGLQRRKIGLDLAAICQGAA